MDTKFFYEAKYFDMVISSCGLLSGEQRYNRIKEIAKHNIWLAARCKNTCVNEEEELVDEIIIICANSIEKSHDELSIIALLELEEYDIIYWLMTKDDENKWSSSTSVFELWRNNNTTVSTAFSVLSNDMTVELSLRIFHKLIQLGYVMDTQSYNAIISKIESTDERDNLFNNMRLNGIVPDAETFFYLMNGAQTFEETMVYFNMCKQSYEEESDTPSKIIEDAYSLILNKTATIEDAKKIYSEFLAKYGENIELKNVFLLKYLQLCNSYYGMSFFWEKYVKEYVFADNNMEAYNNSNTPQNSISKTKENETNPIMLFFPKLCKLGFNNLIDKCLIRITKLFLQKDYNAIEDKNEKKKKMQNVILIIDSFISSIYESGKINIIYKYACVIKDILLLDFNTIEEHIIINNYRMFINLLLSKLYEYSFKKLMYKFIIELSISITKVSAIEKTHISNIFTKHINLLIPSFSFEDNQKLIEATKKNGLTNERIVYLELLTKVANNEQIEYVIKNIKVLKVIKSNTMNDTFSKYVHLVIKTLPTDCALYLYRLLKAEKYPLNIYLYNGFIKKLDRDDALKVFSDMVNPDIYSLAPLLRKWESIDDLQKIIILASKSKIIADFKCEQSILSKINELDCIFELEDRMHEIINNNNIELSWKKILEHICSNQP